MPWKKVGRLVRAMVLGLGAAWWLTAFVRTPTTPVMERAFLEVTASADVPGNLTIFWSDGKRFRAADSVSGAEPLSREPREYRLPLPDTRIGFIRLDPTDGSGAVELSNLRLVEDTGRVLREVSAGELQPLFQIDRIDADGERVTVVSSPGGNDPQLLLRFEPAIDLRHARARSANRHLVPLFGFVSGLSVVALFRWRRRVWRKEAATRGITEVNTLVLPRFSWLTTTGGAALLIGTGFVLFTDIATDSAERTDFAFEVEMSVTQSGLGQVFYDRGRGMHQRDSFTLGVRSGPSQNYRFPLPNATYSALRLDYLNGPGGADILGLRIVSVASNRVVKTFNPSDLLPNDHLAHLVPLANGIRVHTTDDGFDPSLTLRLDPGLILERSRWTNFPQNAAVALLLIALLVVMAAIVHRLGRRDRGPLHWLREWRTFAHFHPRECLFHVALVAVLVACHPVVFLGRSLFSPYFGVPSLYASAPYVPAAPPTHIEYARGADVGAIMWGHVPYSIVQHRSLFRDGELPLWIRDNATGNPLLGQGQSMFGDPFHLLVITADGATWAWDLKYLLARFLFCCGVGWVVWTLTRHFGASALLTFGSAFVGFFAFRINHPAFVSFCYAPWIVVGWLQIARAKNARELHSACAVLWLANWCEATSGTVKEASMLVIGLNLAGLLAWLMTPQQAVLRRRTWMLQTWLTAGFVLITAPWWLSFVQAWQTGWLFYSQPHAVRHPLSWFAGLFDNMFFAEVSPRRTLQAPAGNFLLLLGTCWWLASVVRTRHDRTTLGFVIGAFSALSIAFAVPWLPTEWILQVPGLRNVGHTHNTFSCIALMALLVPAGVGAATMLRERRGAAAWRRRAIAGLLMFALLFAYLRHAASIWGSATIDSLVPEAHTYFFVSLATLVLGCAGLIATLAWRQHIGTWGPGAIFAFAASLLPLLARHGQHVRIPADDFFLSPPARIDLQTRSPAVEWIHQHLDEPARVFALHANLFSGFQGTYNLEGVTGADPFHCREYRELVQTAGLIQPGDWPFVWDPAALADKRRILDMLGVRYYLAAAGEDAPWPWAHRVAELDFAVLKSEGTWPRAFFADHVVAYDDALAFSRLVAQGSGRPFAAVQRRDTAITTTEPPPTSEEAIVPASDYRITSNSTRFVVRTPGPGVVVLIEAWSPGHSNVRINGHPALVLRMNHAFQGVAIPRAGKYEIVFDYFPSWMGLGLGMTAAGVILVVVPLLITIVLRRRPTHRHSR